MFKKPFTRALPAVVLGLSVAGTSEAQTTTTYPITSDTSGGTTTTVRKTYRPLDFTFTTVYESIEIDPVITYSTGVASSPGSQSTQPDALPGRPPTALYSYTAVLGGTFTTTGESSPGGIPLTGDAGYWLLVLDPNWMQDFELTPSSSGINIGFDPLYTQTATATDTNDQVAGFLTFLGNEPGKDFYSNQYNDRPGEAAVPFVDTPQVGDLFWLYIEPNETMQFRWNDFVGGSTDYLAEAEILNGTLEHLGPFKPGATCNGDWRKCAYDGLYGLPYGSAPFLGLDTGRLNTDCGSGTVNGLTVGPYQPCGSALAPVPLPAALPLFGSALGLLAALGYRRRRSVH